MSAKINPNFKFFLFIILSILIPRYETISEINLKVQGEGILDVLNPGFSYEPNEFLINGILYPSCKKSCQFDGGLNNVTIKFENQIDSCENMFYEITSIIEIDLSKFDASKVMNMSQMFSSCTNMKKIILGNINTTLVKNMCRMFFGCEI